MERMGASQLAVSSTVHSPPTSRRRTFAQYGQRRSVASRSGSPGALIVDSTRVPQFGQASFSRSSPEVLTAPEHNTGHGVGSRHVRDDHLVRDR